MNRINMFVTVETDSKDTIIDFIEVELSNGARVSLNWDESDVERTENGFSAQYRRLMFSEKPADGRFSLLCDFNITAVGCYSESRTKCSSLNFREISIEDAYGHYRCRENINVPIEKITYTW